jgi:hypothetical protein
LSILNEDGNAAAEVQRLARASDDGNRWRTELPHDLITGCPDRGQARHKSPLLRNQNLARKEAGKDSPSRDDPRAETQSSRSYNPAWKGDLSGHDDLRNRAEYEGTETGSYSESAEPAGVHNKRHLSRRKTKRRRYPKWHRQGFAETGGDDGGAESWRDSADAKSTSLRHQISNAEKRHQS